MSLAERFARALLSLAVSSRNLDSWSQEDETRRSYVLCDKCGSHNPVGATGCSSCGGRGFAREWVRELVGLSWH